MGSMIGRDSPIPDVILDGIREKVRTEHAAACMAPAWQLAIDHRRWLVAEVDRLRGELARAGACTGAQALPNPAQGQ